MSDKLPTAETFLNNYKFKAGAHIGNSDFDTMAKFAREFAKLHVEAAIKTCIEEAPSGSSTDAVSYEDVVNALKDCYPLTNIK